MTQAHKPITPQLEGVKSGMHSPRPLSPGQSTSNSLLGQPPSAPEEQANGETSVGPADCVEDIEEQGFDDAVAGIYISVPHDPLSYIREEKLTDKDIMLMDGKLKIIVSINQVVRFTRFLSRGLCGLPTGYYWPLYLDVYADLKCSSKPAASDSTPQRTHSLPGRGAKFRRTERRAWSS